MIPRLDNVEFVSLGEDTATVFVVFILLKLKVVMSGVMIMSGSVASYLRRSGAWFILYDDCFF